MTTDTKVAAAAAAPAVVVADPPVAKKEPAAIAVDPFTGEKVDAFVGADAHDEDNFTPDPKARGDFVEQPAATLVVLDPKVAERAAEDAAAASAAAAAAAEQEAAASAAAAAKVVEAKPDQERDAAGRWIPKDRFDQVNERRKKAEADLAARKAQDEAVTKAAQNQYDFDASEKRYMEAVLDGRTEEAQGIRKEIRAAESELFKGQAAEVAQQAVVRKTVKEAVDSVIDTAVETYPALDDTSPDYNQEVVTEIDAMYAGFLQAGQPPAEALQRAINNAAIVHSLKKNGAPAAAVTVEPAKPAEPAKPRQTVAQKLEAAAAQPAAAAGAGVSSASLGQGAIKVAEIPDEEFAALPESTKARLRGDFHVAS